MKKFQKRFLAAILAVLLAFGLIACGGSGDPGAVGTDAGSAGAGTQTSSGSGGGSGTGTGAGENAGPEWVYVPKFVKLDGLEGSYYNARLSGDYLYYAQSSWDEETGASSTSFYRRLLLDDSIEELPVRVDDASVNTFDMAPDGSLYALGYFWKFDEASGQGNSWQELLKYDAEGNQVYHTDLSGVMLRESVEYLDRVIADEQGRVYISTSDKVLFFDAEGEYAGTLKLGDGSMGSRVLAIGRGRDGKIYASYMSNMSNTAFSLLEIEFGRGEAGATFGNFNGSSGNSLNAINADGEKDFLMHDGNTVYEYDLAAQESIPLFNWVDSNVNGTYVMGLSLLSDGRIAGFYSDWSTNESQIILMTKKSAEEADQRETIVVGTFWASQSMKDAVIQFNNSSDRYRVTIRTYAEGSGQDAFEDGQNRLNADIVSDNCPDILAVAYVDAPNLSEKGLFVDLGSYLDASKNLSREDILESVLASGVYGGVQTVLPVRFDVSTVIGRTSQVGDRMQWSVADFMDLVKANPGKRISASGRAVFHYMLWGNLGQFVDWETGTCSFDSPEFIELLKFIKENYSTDDSDWSRDDLAKGAQLFHETNVASFDDVQLISAYFGGEDVTIVGYPTMDGSCGSRIMLQDSYAITTKCRNPEGAWEFLEQYLLAENTGDRYAWGFPVLKSEIERMYEEAIHVEYMLDDNGNQVLDSDGNPIVVGRGARSVVYADGWSYDYRPTTKEEADQVMRLLEAADASQGTREDGIYSIISEESAAYFNGDKTVEAVVDIIQSRARIYVSENS